MNKTEKRHQEKVKEDKKRIEELIESKDPSTIFYLENYCLYQLLYINDAACNACKFLGPELNDIPFKTKAPHTLYAAAMKRVNTYWALVNSTEFDQQSLANLFCELDEFFDGNVDDFRVAIRNALEQHNIPHAHALAALECTRTLCDYAVKEGIDLSKSLTEYGGRGNVLRPLIIIDILSVMEQLCSYVYTAVHITTPINLNEVPEIRDAFTKLHTSHTKAKNFKQALEKATEENKRTNSQSLMYE